MNLQGFRLNSIGATYSLNGAILGNLLVVEIPDNSVLNYCSISLYYYSLLTFFITYLGGTQIVSNIKPHTVVGLGGEGKRVVSLSLIRKRDRLT